jgi:hypothetical protein
VNNKIIGLTALVSAFSMANISYADVPNTFASGEPAVASEINENFSDLDGRVSTLENDNNITGAIEVSVDCSTDSINDTIASAAPANHLTVYIGGTCNERVVITRSNVSLMSAPLIPSTIAFSETPLSPLHTSLNTDGLDGLKGTINVIGAQNVIIKDLTISGATDDGTTIGESGKGVAVRFNASVLIQDSTITGNYSGVVSNSGGVAIISNTNISDNIEYGIIASDGGIVRLIGNNTIDQSTQTSVAAVGAYRSGTITFLGANSVTGSNTALDVYYGSQLRAYYGLLTVNGKSGVGYESQINLRDVAHTGNIIVGTKGTLRLQNNSTQTLSGVNVTGDISVNDFAVFNGNFNTTVDGSVTCNSLLSLATSTGTVTNGLIACDQLENITSNTLPVTPILDPSGLIDPFLPLDPPLLVPY